MRSDAMSRGPAGRDAIRCDEVSIQLAEVADGQSTLPPRTAEHVAGCLRCQAELAQYRKLLRALTSLRDQHTFVDAALLDDLLESLRPVAPVHKLHRLNYRNKKVAIGGIAAAATAGAAAGAIVIASRLAGQRRLAS